MGKEGRSMRRKVHSRLLVQGEEIHTLYRTGKKANTKRFILNKLDISFESIEKAYFELNKDIGKRTFPKGSRLAIG